MIDDLVSSIHISSKGRSNPRVVKKRIKKVPSKKGEEPMNRRFDRMPIIK